MADVGYLAKLYRNTGTYDAPTWEEIDLVRDVTVTLSADEVDLTTRASGGFKQAGAGLKELTFEFEARWKGDDTNLAALRDAYLNGTSVELLALDGPVTTPGSQGPRTTCVITKFDRSEPLADAITVSITAKPTPSEHNPEWFTAS